MVAACGCCRALVRGLWFACRYNESMLVRSLGRLLCLLIAVVFLVACGAQPVKRPDWVKSETQTSISMFESMIAYHAFAAGLSTTDWVREMANLRTSPRTNDETLCVRQAMLAAAPGAPAAERAQAVGVYEQCERELRRRDSQLVGFVALLRAELAERIRYEERLREAQRRADERAQKLDELKEIERNLLERSTGPRPKKP